MPYIGIENLLDKSAGSVYKLVILASKRALEIAEGQPKLSVADPATKPSTVALKEISENRIQYQKAKTEK